LRAAGCRLERGEAMDEEGEEEEQDEKIGESLQSAVKKDSLL